MKTKIYLQNKLAGVLLLGFVLFASGCGTKVHYGVAEINSIPPGAEVINLKDSSHLGSTPVKVSFSGEADTSQFVTVQLRKIGFRDRITTFWINRRHETVEAAQEEAIDVHVELEKK